MREECPDSETLAAYLDDRLGPDEAQSLVDHLADCDDCRREVALMRLGAGAPGEPVPAELRARVLAAIVSRDRCPDPQVIAAYVEEKLDAEEESELFDHLADCDECRREIALMELARGASQLARPVPAELKARVAGAVTRSSRRLRLVPRPARTPFAAFAAAAAVVAVAVVLAVAYRARAQKAPRLDAPVVDRPSVPPPERVPDLRPEPAPRPEPEEARAPEEPPAPPEPPQPPPEAPRPEPPAPSPAPEAPRPERRPTRTRDAVALKFASVKLSDLTGELAIRRRGKDRKEKVSGPVEVGNGDVLIADRSTAFFLLEDYPITLMPHTEVGIAFEVGTSAPALVLERGATLVDSTAGATRWYVGSKHVSVWIDRTRAQFAAAVEEDSLGLTALAGHLTGQDDYGRPFDLRSGERLLASARTAQVGPDPNAPRLAAALASTRPPTRTVFHAGFEDAPALSEGAIDRDRGGNAYLAALDRKGTLGAAVRLPKEFGFRNDLVVRMRVRTNLAESRIVIAVEDKAQLVATHKVRRDQRAQWLTVEFAFDDPDVKLLPVKENAAATITGRDRLLTIGATGRRQDVFGDERAYLQLDDVQIAARAP